MRALTLVLALAALGCSASRELVYADGGSIDAPLANVRPVAVVADTTTLVGERVELSGAGSSDPEECSLAEGADGSARPARLRRRAASPIGR